MGLDYKHHREYIRIRFFSGVSLAYQGLFQWQLGTPSQLASNTPRIYPQFFLLSTDVDGLYGTDMNEARFYAGFIHLLDFLGWYKIIKWGGVNRTILYWWLS